MPERSTMVVTIELWSVYQAWTGKEVKQWQLCHNGTPLLGFSTRQAAVAQARDWGWEIEEDSGVEQGE
jgi:hypothetical protein